MARIIAYPNATSISPDDCLIGTQKDNSGSYSNNPTKNFAVGSVVSAGLGYTTYTALLTQVGVAAPVPTVVKNDTGVTYTWTRSAKGDYTITASSPVFNAATTLVFGNIGSRSKQDYFRWKVAAGGTDIAVTTYDNAGNPEDDIFVGGSFEIRIYS